MFANRNETCKYSSKPGSLSAHDANPSLMEDRGIVTTESGHANGVNITEIYRSLAVALPDPNIVNRLLIPYSSVWHRCLRKYGTTAACCPRWNRPKDTAKLVVMRRATKLHEVGLRTPRQKRSGSLDFHTSSASASSPCQFDGSPSILSKAVCLLRLFHKPQSFETARCLKVMQQQPTLQNRRCIRPSDKNQNNKNTSSPLQDTSRCIYASAPDHPSCPYTRNSNSQSSLPLGCADRNLSIPAQSEPI